MEAQATVGGDRSGSSPMTIGGVGVPATHETAVVPEDHHLEVALDGGDGQRAGGELHALTTDTGEENGVLHDESKFPVKWAFEQKLHHYDYSA